jgi:hypothetical protein
MRCHVLILRVAHSVLGVCVVSYNKLHHRSNATKLGSINSNNIQDDIRALTHARSVGSHHIIPTSPQRW